MKKTLLILALLGGGIINTKAQRAQDKVPHRVQTCPKIGSERTEIILPQVNGYNIYKGDFHTHTMYSDARISPKGRVMEAWSDGLDILAITDHYEARENEKNLLKVLAKYSEDGKPKRSLSAAPYSKPKDGSDPGVMADFNAIHQEAVSENRWAGYNLLLIKGCEFGRNTNDKGHFNALFVKDLNTLYSYNLEDSFRKVREQGGIVIHNHPSYKRPKGSTDKSEWDKMVYGEGLIKGVEVANGYNFYPRMVRRCIEEKLAMFGNTDEHRFTTYRFGSRNVFRTMTLVFAKECTEEAIKEAILDCRTLVYSGGCVIGEEQLLSDFLNASIHCQQVMENKKKGERTYTLTNMTSFPYRLRQGKTIHELEPFETITISFGKDKNSGELLPPKFRVENMWHIDYKHPNIEIEIDKKLK